MLALSALIAGCNQSRGPAFELTDVTGAVQPTVQDLANKKSFLEDNSQTPRKVRLS